MPSRLTTVIAVSNVKNQLYQLEMLFESFREYNFKYPVHSLIYKVNEQEPWLDEWKELNDLYPEIKFFYYSDNGSLDTQLKYYHNLHRFFSLRNHFRENPYLENEAILYLDSDIILAKEMDLDDLLEDDINYGADICSYTNHSYFVGKRSRVRPEKLEEWDKSKPLNQLWSMFGLEEETFKKFNDNNGGVPWVLKNINWEFWEECLQKTVPAYKTIKSLNQWFFEGNTQKERDDNGIQAFCQDMFSINWLLYSQGKEVKVTHKLNFSWATSNIENVAETSHIHNAGIPSLDFKFEGIGPAFFKGKYIDGTISPFDKSEEEYLNSIHTNETSKKYANWYYVDYLLKVKNKNHGKKQLEGLDKI